MRTTQHTVQLIASYALEAPDPFAEIDAVRRAVRGAVLRAALEAEAWSLHRAAARLGRTTSTIQSELINHHPELEAERQKNIAR
jgi:hypothetical protein